ncbi:MAG: serine hydrolase, partial [Pseudomonadales bacterium]|nr:serine hydrolase [Pseudomonadales bacterium]
DPVRKVVIVTHSAWSTAVGEEYSKHRGAFLGALADAL